MNVTYLTAHGAILKNTLNKHKGEAGSQMGLRELVEQYVSIFPNESSLLKLAQEQVQNESDADLTRRSNFTGHFTASTFVVCRRTKRVLLLEHKALKKMLQPGGHIDSGETPLQAVYRELEEETGIHADQVEYRALQPGFPLLPFDIDTHFIPENPKKQERSHYHHDMRYVFIVKDELEIAIDDHESNNFEWTDWDLFVEQPHFKKVASKVEEIIYARSPAHFFEKVQASIGNNIKDNTRCVAIQHIIPSTYEYILYLNAIFNGRLKIFSKPKSIDKTILAKLKSRGVEVECAARDKDPVQFFLNGDKTTPTVLIDIGGYFCALAQTKGLSIIGIVEDTENGHKKYLELADQIKYPVLSVARSPLKQNEDRLVGEAVVHAADTVLRQKNIVLDYCRAAVIGFGKVGEGVCGALVKKNIKPLVVEINPQRLVKAVNAYCYASTLDRALAESKVIFCASGSNSLSIQDFRKIRNGAFVVSVTSSDDEFNLDYLKSEYRESEDSPHITRYIGDRNYFYLMNHGDAVNFLYNAALGSFIYLVLAEILASILFLSQPGNHAKGLHDSRDEFRDTIATLWLQEFTSH